MCIYIHRYTDIYIYIHTQTDTISKLSHSIVSSPLRLTVSQLEGMKRGVCQLSPEILFGARSLLIPTELRFERKVSHTLNH